MFKESEIGVAYAYMPLNISQPGDYRLGIGSNDGARLWINGKLVLDHMIARKAEPNQDIVTVALNEGTNEILLKIDQLGGGWGFFFTLIDN